MQKKKYYYYKKKVKTKLYYCVELEVGFETSTQAQQELGIDSSSIVKACKGIRKSAGKHPITKKPLHWIYLDINKK